MIFSVTSSSCFAIIAASFILALPSTAIHPACELLGQGCRGNQLTSQNGSNIRINTNATVPARVVISTQGEESQDELAANSSSTAILKRHLQSIQEYLDNPFHHLAQQQMDLDDEIDNDDGDSLPALVATLEDLKEQVRDSDKAQEFYSLGGWPLVATLVSNNVHFRAIDDSNKDDDGELVKKIWAIRANAAWVMGAAVKNVAEFRSWVLEPIVDDDNTPTTALELIVQALLEVSDAADFPGSCSQSTLEYQEELASRSVYALESFLIGNAPAQIAFSNMSSNPVRILGVQAKKWAQEAASTAASSTSSNAPMSRHAIKMTTRLLSLAMDIVQDNVIVESFSTTDEWCQAARQAAALTPATAFKRLVFRSLQSTAIKAAATLEPYCSLQSMSLPLDMVDQD
jgi:hypothetical protein